MSRLGDLRRLAGAVAARSAGLLVAQALARDVGLAPRTAARYLDLFDLTFLTRRIPAWATNATARAVATPKLLMTDSGLCAYVLGMSAGRLATPIQPAGRWWRPEYWASSDRGAGQSSRAVGATWCPTRPAGRFSMRAVGPN